MLLKQVEKFRDHETWVTNFDGVAKPSRHVDLGKRASFQFIVVLVREGCRGASIARQQMEKFFEPVGVKPEARRQLPENRPEFLAEREQA